MTLAPCCTVSLPAALEPEGAEVAEISPQGATGAPVGGHVGRIPLLLRRASAVFRELGEALEELAAEAQNQLAAGPERALMCDVVEAPAAARSTSPAVLGRLLSVEDVALLLSVKTRTVRRWRAEGKLPAAIAISGIVRWRAEVIEAWIADREEASS